MDFININSTELERAHASALRFFLTSLEVAPSYKHRKVVVSFRILFDTSRNTVRPNKFTV